jgi:hypothetical protein
MDDRDLLERLRRYGSAAAPPEPAYGRLLDRRDRKRRASRVASLVMGLLVFGAGAAVAAVAFVGHGPGAKHPRTGFGDGGTTHPSALVAGPGRYYYWKTDRVMPGRDVIEEMWWGEDGSGRYFVDQSNPNYGVLSGMTWNDPKDFPGVFPFESDLSDLSTDPEVLGGQLVERSAPNGASPQPQVTIAPTTSLESSALWRSAVQLLQMGNATPRLRVALYDVLAQIPETIDGRGEDPAGRPAITITMAYGEYYGGAAQTLYFDPQTHLLMAMTGGQDGAMIVVDDGIADSTSATPSADQRFFAASTP